MTKVAVVMPAWNEAEGLPGFVMELNDALSEWSPAFVVVDDCSTDATSKTALSLAQLGVSISVKANESNCGHGPSTITALNLGLALETDFVVAVDGDGQFVGEDVRLVIDQLVATEADVVEGVRTSRNDPVYRRLVSLATRLLVASRAHALPADANTPLRAYRANTLARILAAMPSEAATPNLIVSALCRKWHMRIVEVPVQSIPRRGSDPEGSTWGKARKRIPNRRFIKFCIRASNEWIAGVASRDSLSRPH